MRLVIGCLAGLSRRDGCGCNSVEGTFAIGTRPIVG